MIIKAVVEAAKNKEMRYLKASKDFNIPKRTIKRYVQNDSVIVKIPLRRKTAIFIYKKGHIK